MKRTKRVWIGLIFNIVWGSCWVSSANAEVITMGLTKHRDPASAVELDGRQRTTSASLAMFMNAHGADYFTVSPASRRAFS